VHLWRRSYEIAPPGEESLRDTAARVLPYNVQEILPRVLRSERTLVSAHGMQPPTMSGRAVCLGGGRVPRHARMVRDTCSLEIEIAA